MSSLTAQRSFSHGEVAPALYARTDLAAYARALRALRNGIVLKTGGVRARPGTVYKGTTKSSAWARLLPVVFDDDQNYVLEMGVSYLRFWKDGALVTATVTGAWANTTAYTAGTVVSRSGTNYVALVAHTSVAATDEPAVGSGWQLVWYALTGTTYELPIPYTTQAQIRAVQYQQEYGVVRFAHNTFTRRTLTRYANNRWGIAEATAAYTLAAPANLATDAPTPGDVASWCVTAYDSVTRTESLASSPVSSDTAPALASVFTETWDSVTGATSYKVYRSDDLSVFGFVYETTTTTFIDNGHLNPDLSMNPPVAAAAFSSSGDYPGVIGAYQQRLLLAGTTNDPSTVQTSKVAAPDDFTISSPLVDSDALSWKMVGARVVRPRHFVEVARQLLQFANTGEYVIEGDDTGILSPGGINPRQISAHGASATPAPLVVGQSALYVQERGGIIRDLASDAAGDVGGDLTLTAAHLVEGYEIVDWAYQPTPHPIIWAVRSDGALLSLTYERASGILGWARHDTDNGDDTYESVAVVPEGSSTTRMDALYAVVKRTINSSTVRYVERFANQTDAIASRVMSDASLVVTQPYTTVTLTNELFDIGNNWTTYDCTGSGGTGTWASTDVGRTLTLVVGATTEVWTVMTYSSPTVIVIRRGAAGAAIALTRTKPNWYLSTGSLSHLEGEAVSITLDGVVYASPNNADYATITVTSGAAAITTGYNTAVIGLPFTTDVQTLDLDGAASSRKDAGALVTRVGLWLDASRPPFAAVDFPTSDESVVGMQAIPALDSDKNTTDDLITDYIEGGMDGAWNNTGRIALRHVDPSPLTILAIVPQGHFGRS